MKAVRISENEFTLYLRREDTEYLAVLFPALIRDYDQIDFTWFIRVVEKELLIRLEYLLKESAGTETANGVRCMSLDFNELRGLSSLFGGLKSHKTSNIKLYDYGLSTDVVINMDHRLMDSMRERPITDRIKRKKKRR